MKKRLKKLCALLLVAGVASGCVATRNSGASLDGLSAAHAADARALAEISAEQLAERHAPAHTALALARADGAFGKHVACGALKGRRDICAAERFPFLFFIMAVIYHGRL